MDEQPLKTIGKQNKQQLILPDMLVDIMKIYVKKIDGVVLPEKKTPRSAGYDIKATSDPKIVGEQNSDGTWKRIDYIEYETNLFLAPEVVTAHLDLRPRSSVSKYNLILANCIGLLDNDYRGMVLARFSYTWQPEDLTWGLQNEKNCIFGTPNMTKIYKKGDDLAQLVGAMTIDLEFEFKDDLNKTQRGEGGFGHTDLKINNDVMRESVKTTLEEIYNKAGGVQVKEKYIEEIKKRDQGQ
jgi:dUTP pyrophosphatase